MKILFVIENLGSGGAQRQMVNLAISFKKKGHNITFLVYHKSDFYKGYLVENEIPIYKIIENHYIKRLIFMRRFIRKGKFDSVLSFMQTSNLICEISSLPFRKWKLVVSERSSNPKILKNLSFRFIRLFHLLADHVVANSFENINMVKRANPLISDKKLQVIYNMVDLEKWKPIQINNIDNFNIIVAASHQYLKNASGLIEAMNLLPHEIKHKIRINWYGNKRGDNSFIEAKKLVSKYKLENNVVFFEAIKDIHIKMQHADAVGLFSFYEGFPNAVTEGMACGKPIICTDVSDLSRIIKEGMNGFLCKANDIKSISSAIQRLVNTSKYDLEKISKNNRKKASELFNSNIVSTNYLNLLTNEK